MGVHNKTVNATGQWHARHMARTHGLPAKEIAALTAEMGSLDSQYRLARSRDECAECGCSFPELARRKAQRQRKHDDTK
jgi:hypothetical protein